MDLMLLVDNKKKIFCYFVIINNVFISHLIDDGLTTKLYFLKLSYIY